MPGVDRENLYQVLGHVANELNNANNGIKAYERLIKYLEWANMAVGSLSTYLHPEDIDRLVYTRGYDHLFAASATDLDTRQGGRVLNDLLNFEFARQTQLFEAVRRWLDRQINRWKPLGTFIVCDTTVFIRHPNKIRDIDYHLLIEGEVEGDVVRVPPVERRNIHVLVPAAVIKELDRLKESGKDHVRWRAGHTLGVIDELFDDPTTQPELYRKQISHTSCTASIELLIDPVGHAPLPDADDEIIERVLATQPLAGREITLITYDTSMSTKARTAGVKVVKFKHDPGLEPEAERHRKSRAQAS